MANVRLLNLCRRGSCPSSAASVRSTSVMSLRRASTTRTASEAGQSFPSPPTVEAHVAKRDECVDLDVHLGGSIEKGLDEPVHRLLLEDVRPVLVWAGVRGQAAQ